MLYLSRTGKNTPFVGVKIAFLGYGKASDLLRLPADTDKEGRKRQIVLEF